MTVGNVYRASCVFTAPEADGEMVFTMHYRLESEPVLPPSNTPSRDLAEYIEAILTADYIPLLSDSIQFEVVNVIGITDPTETGRKPSGLQGSVARACTSYRQTVINRNSTGLRGRSYTGYQEYMAPTEDQQSNGVLDPAFVTSMDAIADDMLEFGTILISRQFVQGVYSRKLSIFTPLSGTKINDRCGSNKRRFST